MQLLSRLESRALGGMAAPPGKNGPLAFQQGKNELWIRRSSAVPRTEDTLRLSGRHEGGCAHATRARGPSPRRKRRKRAGEFSASLLLQKIEELVGPVDEFTGRNLLPLFAPAQDHHHQGGRQQGHDDEPSFLRVMRKGVPRGGRAPALEVELGMAETQRCARRRRPGAGGTAKRSVFSIPVFQSLRGQGYRLRTALGLKLLASGFQGLFIIARLWHWLSRRHPESDAEKERYHDP